MHKRRDGSTVSGQRASDGGLRIPQWILVSLFSAALGGAGIFFMRAWDARSADAAMIESVATLKKNQSFLFEKTNGQDARISKNSYDIGVVSTKIDNLTAGQDKILSFILSQKGDRDGR